MYCYGLMKAGGYYAQDKSRKGLLRQREHAHVPCHLERPGTVRSAVVEGAELQRGWQARFTIGLAHCTAPCEAGTATDYFDAGLQQVAGKRPTNGLPQVRIDYSPLVTCAMAAIWLSYGSSTTART
jgi:hypothetical protein